LCWTGAEITGDSIDEVLFVVFNQRRDSLEAIAPQRERWVALCGVGAALSVEQPA
jgi:hypothetical protein